MLTLTETVTQCSECGGRVFGVLLDATANVNKLHILHAVVPTKQAQFSVNCSCLQCGGSENAVLPASCSAMREAEVRAGGGE